jgi:hypothetical protein
MFRSIASVAAASLASPATFPATPGLGYTLFYRIHTREQEITAAYVFSMDIQAV